MLESIKYQEGKAYHMIDPNAQESLMIASLDQIEGLEGTPKVKFYMYIDDQFMYKARTLPPSEKPIINLEIDM